MGFNELEKYVVELKTFLEQNDLSETEIIMMVYLDLGLKLKFNKEFFFGGSKVRHDMYNGAFYLDNLNECLRKGEITCKSVSYLLRYVLSNLGINIKVIEDEEDMRKYKHVLNLIIPKDGTEPYTIDLQEDIINIHYHDKTFDFGLSRDGKSYVVSQEEQKRMHEKFGYISKNNPYVSEYIALLQYHLPLFSTFKEQVEFVLLNINPIDDTTVDYFERRWRHQRILEKLFVSKELSACSLWNKIRMIEIYRVNENGEKEFSNAFSIDSSVYLYSISEGIYIKYTIDEFASKMLDEGLESNQNILGLKGALNRIKNKEKVLKQEC